MPGVGSTATVLASSQPWVKASDAHRHVRGSRIAFIGAMVVVVVVVVVNVVVVVVVVVVAVVVVVTMVLTLLARCCRF